MSHLVGIAIPDLGFSQDSSPLPFADDHVPGSAFAGTGILRGLFAFQVGMGFLVLQGG